MSNHMPQRPIDTGPPPMPWTEYVSTLKEKYRDVVLSDPAEPEMQAFLERNPALVPGAFPNGVGHGAFPEALISQPDLRGIGERRPDFMWLARNSAMIQPALIEIERPSKRWLVGTNRNPQQSAELTQALNQLRQWEQWLDKRSNQETLLEAYGVPPEWRAKRALRPQFWLIYGRRDENPDEIAKLRAYLHDRGLNVHAYEHLRAPNEWCKDYITVRPLDDGKYRALHVPPTAKWTASSPESWIAVTGRAEAVRRSTEHSDGRKTALIEQIAEWDHWANWWLNESRRFCE